MTITCQSAIANYSIHYFASHSRLSHFRKCIPGCHWSFSWAKQASGSLLNLQFRRIHCTYCVCIEHQYYGYLSRIATMLNTKFLLLGSDLIVRLENHLDRGRKTRANHYVVLCLIWFAKAIGSRQSSCNWTRLTRLGEDLVSFLLRSCHRYLLSSATKSASWHRN